MNRYLLAGMCLLAFVAGGVAQLALRRSRGPEVKFERAVESSRSALPAAARQTAEAPTQPPDSPAAPVAEARGADAETPVETADVVGGVEEKSGVTAGKTRHVSRRAARGASKTAYRAGRGRVPALNRAATADRNTRTADAGGGRLRQTAEGAKKTGSWLGRKLKKVGDVFHE